MKQNRNEDGKQLPQQDVVEVENLSTKPNFII